MALTGPPSVQARMISVYLLCGFAIKVEVTLYFSKETKTSGARYIIPAFRGRAKAQHVSWVDYDKATREMIAEILLWLKSKGHKPKQKDLRVTSGGKATPEITFKNQQLKLH